jgi:hypothetical protein
MPQTDATFQGRVQGVSILGVQSPIRGERSKHGSAPTPNLPAAGDGGLGCKPDSQF